MLLLGEVRLPGLLLLPLLAHLPFHECLDYGAHASKRVVHSPNEVFRADLISKQCPRDVSQKKWSRHHGVPCVTQGCDCLLRTRAASARSPEWSLAAR